MPHYQYKARNTVGALVNGALEATTLDAAASELLGQGITPIDIRQTSGRPKTDKAASTSGRTGRPRAGAKQQNGFQQLNDALMGKKIDANELIIFARQMRSLTKAGMPLDRALTGLQASVKNPKFRDLLQEVQRSLESGQNLATALGQHPKVFSPLFLSMVDVGENTGRLDLAFEQIGRYLELDKNTKKQVKSATRYPSFVLVTIAVALGVITYFVIPAFADTFARLGAELPFETRLLIGISDFVVQWWQFLIGGSVALYFAFRTWGRSRRGGLIWDNKKMSLPLIGPVYQRVALARFARTFAMVMKAGVPIVHGMGVVAGAVGNRFIARRILKMREAISRGESLYNAALATNMF
ncbi:MAG: type II secretion system F family protein, partial [Pseudohongiella sp.]